ncbi:MAG: hypothetical protein ACFCUG_11520 [Thiotrichales bacterium]
MRKLSFALLSLLFASTNLFAYSQSIDFFESDIKVPATVGAIDIAVVLSGIFDPASNATLDMGAQVDIYLESGVVDSDPFQAIPENLGGMFKAVFSTASQELSAASLASISAFSVGFEADISRASQFGSTRQTPTGPFDFSYDATAQRDASLSIPALLPLFLGGLLVLSRNAFRLSDPTQHNAASS